LIDDYLFNYSLALLGYFNSKVWDNILKISEQAYSQIKDKLLAFLFTSQAKCCNYFKKKNLLPANSPEPSLSVARLEEIQSFNHSILRLFFFFRVR
jgi:hypothetical protein